MLSLFVSVLYLISRKVLVLLDKLKNCRRFWLRASVAKKIFSSSGLDGAVSLITKVAWKIFVLNPRKN